MKYTKRQFKNKFENSYWLNLYAAIRSIETRKEFKQIKYRNISEDKVLLSINNIYKPLTTLSVSKDQVKVINNQLSNIPKFQTIRQQSIGVTEGPPPIVYYATGSMAGVGSLTGVGNHYFYTSAGVTGNGVIMASGTLFESFLTSGSLLGVGSLAGSGTLFESFLTSGSLTGVGTLAGSSELHFYTSGSMAGVGTLAGSSELHFYTSGSLTGVGALAGSGTFTEEPITAPEFVGINYWNWSAKDLSEASGTHIGTWTDRINSLVLTQSTVTRKPHKNAVFGYPSLEFDSGISASYLQVSAGDATINTFSDFNEFTIFVAARAEQAYHYDYVIGPPVEKYYKQDVIRLDATDSVANLSFHLAQTYEDDVYSFDSYVAYDDVTVGYPTADLSLGTGITIFGFTTTSSLGTPGPSISFKSASLGYDYSAGVNKPTSNFYSSGTFYVGDTLTAGYAGQTSSLSNIFEVIVYAGELSSSQLTEVFDYLHGQWKIFTPLSLSPLIWLDASDISTLWQDSARTTPVTTTGQVVEAWDDKSGNDRHATNASCTATYQATGFSGSLPSVRATGQTTDTLSTATWTLATPCTMFAVYHHTGSSGTRYLSYHSSGAGTRVLYASDAATGTGPGFYDGVSHKAFGVEVTDANAFALVMKTNNTGSLYRQDTEVGTAQTFTDWSSNSTHTILGSASGLFHGYLAEYLIFDGELATSDRQDVMTYLVNKWGL